MIVMSWHIFFGLTRWPYNGSPAMDRRTGQPTRVKGYVQKWEEIAESGQQAWAVIGDHIRANSQPTDTMYVWGWFPGIYVQAQRMSPTPKAFEGMMHMLPPEQLGQRVQEIVHAFEKNPPKFIVDTRKVHFPLTRPPLELWPRMKEGFVPPQEAVMKQFDQMYANFLKEKVDPTEAKRYEVMQPLRWYVMKNYEVVDDIGSQVLFRRKS